MTRTSAASVDVLALIDAIYEAATAPERWTDFLHLFARACNSAAATMFVHDFSMLPGDSSGSFLLQQGFDPACVQSYAEHFSNVNVWLKDEARFPQGAVVQSGELYPDDALLKTEWHSDWLRPQGLFYAIGSTLVRSDDASVNLTLLRSRAAGEYDNADRKLVKALVPHLQRSLAIHRQFWQVSTAHAAAASVLDEMPHGIVFLGGDGRVLYMNRAAEGLFKKRDGLFLDSKGQCDARIGDERAALHKLIRAAPRTADRSQVRPGGSMQITRSQGSKLSVLVAPVSRQLPDNLGALAIKPLTVMIIGDPDTSDRSPSDRLRGLYGLAAAEARLAAALVSGLTLQQYAEANGVTRNTAATQLKSIMTKLGAGRQSDVVRIILSGPAGVST